MGDDGGPGGEEWIFDSSLGHESAFRPPASGKAPRKPSGEAQKEPEPTFEPFTLVLGARTVIEGWEVRRILTQAAHLVNHLSSSAAN